MLPHVYVRDLQVPERFAVVNELAVDVLVKVSFMICLVHSILLSFCATTLPKSRLVYVRASGR